MLFRSRFVALAEWRGGRLAREAKALAPSACLWAQGARDPAEILYEKIVTQAVRCHDPFLRVRGNWLVRRLAPDSFSFEMDSLPQHRDETALLHAMGWETANVHLGSREAAEAVRRDLEKRPGDWLLTAAQKMVRATFSDWMEWRESPLAG